MHKAEAQMFAAASAGDVQALQEALDDGADVLTLEPEEGMSR
jgi:hypothetical protein